MRLRKKRDIIRGMMKNSHLFFQEERVVMKTTHLYFQEEEEKGVIYDRKYPSLLPRKKKKKKKLF